MYIVHVTRNNRTGLRSQNVPPLFALHYPASTAVRTAVNAIFGHLRIICCRYFPAEFLAISDAHCNAWRQGRLSPLEAGGNPPPRTPTPPPLPFPLPHFHPSPPPRSRVRHGRVPGRVCSVGMGVRGFLPGKFFDLYMPVGEFYCILVIKSAPWFQHFCLNNYISFTTWANNFKCWPHRLILLINIFQIKSSLLHKRPASSLQWQCWYMNCEWVKLCA